MRFTRPGARTTSTADRSWAAAGSRSTSAARSADGSTFAAAGPESRLRIGVPWGARRQIRSLRLPHHSTKRATTVARDGRHEETMSIAAGDALTLELDRGFVIASGIECSAPVIDGGIRQDELRKTGHDESVEADLALIAEFGIRYLRYGIPFHVVAADPGRLDWRWTDRAMSALQ